MVPLFVAIPLTSSLSYVCFLGSALSKLLALSFVSENEKSFTLRYTSVSDALSGSVNSLNVNVNLSPGFTCLDPWFLLELVQSFLTFLLTP